MRFLPVLSTALIGLLFFIWPIPHTIAARNLLLLACLVLFGYLSWNNAASKSCLRPAKAAAVWYIALTAWIVIGALFISKETVWSLSEISGQWLKGGAALTLGVMAALAAGQNKWLSGRSLLVCITAVLGVHVLYVVVTDMAVFFQQGWLPRRVPGLTEGPDKMNYLTNTLLAILVSEVFFRMAFRSRLLPMNNGLLAAAIALAAFSSYVEGMRNGMMAALFLFASTGSLYWIEKRQKVKTGLLLAGLALLLATSGVFGYLNYKVDPRWKTLVETIPIAMDTQQHRAWLDYEKHPLPNLANGQPVDPSAYLRAAWMKEGVILVLEHPLGLGFGRNAFGHGIKEKYGEGGGHSHSGFLDLAIGTGIPGALLWLAFLLNLLYLAAKNYFSRQNQYALIMFFLVAGYLARMLVDSIIRDHMLEQFMFLVGLFTVLMLKGEGQETPPKQPGNGREHA